MQVELLLEYLGVSRLLFPAQNWIGQTLLFRPAIPATLEG